MDPTLIGPDPQVGVGSEGQGARPHGSHHETDAAGPGPLPVPPVPHGDAQRSLGYRLGSMGLQYESVCATRVGDDTPSSTQPFRTGFQ